MEQLKFDYPSAVRPVTKRAHVGVVGSGDMEVLMQPSETGGAQVSILTSVNGFGASWKAVSYTHLDVYKRQFLSG